MKQIYNMYRIYYISILLGALFLFSVEMSAQQELNRPSVVKIEGESLLPENTSKKDITANQQVIQADGFSYYTTAAGIYIYFPKPNNYVRLFALTGQVIWSGELVSGRFFIPTGEGIYFLRVNNKSYKISCKKT
ncbi:MAG: hypothetical protein BWY08_00285 [Bacteroidetes bacterium ADurb.Bin174]|nr:MAG: hypothetical protein BWY08_00285 [Bacteroidetes bacterium ADurb.Bin174]